HESEETTDMFSRKISIKKHD
ncbi:hypothetical protein EC34870_3060B, partial [Escherichia coli 3.4870]